MLPANIQSGRTDGRPEQIFLGTEAAVDIGHVHTDIGSQIAQRGGAVRLSRETRHGSPENTLAGVSAGVGGCCSDWRYVGNGHLRILRGLMLSRYSLLLSAMEVNIVDIDQ
jgi:hypothetical protein